MPALVPAAIYVLTQMVDDWVGKGPAMIHWAARRHDAPPIAWAASLVVAGGDQLSLQERVSVEDATRRFFTPEEVEDLGALLVNHSLAAEQSLRYGRVELPTTAEVVVAMQNANPFGARTLWRIRPPDPILAGHAVPCEGIVTLWPWPELAPEEITALMAMRNNMEIGATRPGQSSAAQ